MNQNRLTVTQSIIIINVVVYVVGLLVQRPSFFCITDPSLTSALDAPNTPVLEILGAYSWFTCFREGELWRLISYQFLHASFTHLLFNMWALYFFGPVIEMALGGRRFLAFYLICGVSGALFSSALGALNFYGTADTLFPLPLAAYLGLDPNIPLYTWQLVPLVGASAAIYGVMVATAILYPRVQVSLLFPPVTLSLRVFALVIIAVAAATVLLGWTNAGGEAGHLGGILMGAILIRFFCRGRNEWEG